MDPATHGSVLLGKEETRVGRIGQASREIVLVPAQLLRKGQFSVVLHLGRSSHLSSQWEMLRAASRQGIGKKKILTKMLGKKKCC